MFNITSYWGNINQNHEILLHTHWNGFKRKREIITSVGKDMENSEPSVTAGKNSEPTLEISLVTPPKVRQRVTICLRNSTSRYIFKRNENPRPLKDLYISVHSRVIHCSPKAETPLISNNDRWINKTWYKHTMEQNLVINKMRY